MAPRQDNDNETAERGRAAAALEAARERTLSAYETARERSRDTARQVTDQLSIYPVGAVVGGLAVGALLAFLLPRTEREDRLLGPTGRKLAGAAREAAQKGIDAGRERAQDLSGELGSKVGRAVAEAVGVKE
ncbi:hypothetical protein [Sphingosinicella sp.]|uniref:hypothetical protein n=1 Tax=Sphingosinicella sp. TaxID=1917971 RepID=UPI004037C847